MKKKNKSFIGIAVGVLVIIVSLFIYDSTTRLSEEEYKEEMEGSFNDISDRLIREIEDIKDIKPPYKKSGEYKDVVEAMDYYEGVAERFPDALIELDYDELNEIISDMNKAGSIIEGVEL